MKALWANIKVIGFLLVAVLIGALKFFVDRSRRLGKELERRKAEKKAIKEMDRAIDDIKQQHAEEDREDEIESRSDKPRRRDDFSDTW